jgi:hypothetical protein
MYIHTYIPTFSAEEPKPNGMTEERINGNELEAYLQPPNMLKNYETTTKTKVGGEGRTNLPSKS